MSKARFSGRNAFVTGAASGIGRALTELLVADGAQVFAVDINPDFPAEEEPGVVRQVCDVADPAQVAAAIEASVAQLGSIDLLFNNAGTGSFAETPDIDDATWRRVFAINVDAILYACRAAIPHMRRQGGGAIVNTASISGLHADYGFTAYNASKGAVINYTRSLAIDHGRDNIRVNAVCPGFIAGTGLTAGLDATPARAVWDEVVPLGRGGTPREMAQVAAFLASDDAAYMTGSIVVADGGLTAHTGQPNLMAMFRSMQ